MYTALAPICMPWPTSLAFGITWMPSRPMIPDRLLPTSMNPARLLVNVQELQFCHALDTGGDLEDESPFSTVELKPSRHYAVYFIPGIKMTQETIDKGLMN
jgi:hypothetical protein